MRFYEELVSIGVLDKIPSWVAQGAPSPLQRAEQYLLLTTDERFREEQRPVFAALIDEMCRSGMAPMAQKLTEKAAEGVSSALVRVRAEAALQLDAAATAFQSFQLEKQLDPIVRNSGAGV
jgi:hypothetical protein